MHEEINSIPQIIIICLFVASLIAITTLYSTFMATQNEPSIIGSKNSIEYKLMSAECISTKNINNNTEKFILDKTLLNSYTKGSIPCINLTGSYYSIRITSYSGDEWNFKSDGLSDETYLNGIALGIRGYCDIAYDYVEALSRVDKSIFNKDVNSEVGILTHRPVNIYDPSSESMSIGNAIAFVDPDACYEDKPYPLCICDIPCPCEYGCTCATGCKATSGDEPAEIGYNEKCGGKK